jgi:hypothetical protein
MITTQKRLLTCQEYQVCWHSTKIPQEEQGGTTKNIILFILTGQATHFMSALSQTHKIASALKTRNRIGKLTKHKV